MLDGKLPDLPLEYFHHRIFRCTIQLTPAKYLFVRLLIIHPPTPLQGKIRNRNTSWNGLRNFCAWNNTTYSLTQVTWANTRFLSSQGGLNALHVACLKGNSDIVEALLQASESQDKFCQRKRLPSDLHIALNARTEEVCAGYIVGCFLHGQLYPT